MTRINRRDFLKLAAFLTAGSGLVAWGTATQLQNADLTTKALVAGTQDQISPALHVLNRLTFGPRPGQVAEVEAMGVDAFIEAQLDYQQLDTSRASAVTDGFDTLTKTIPELSLVGKFRVAYEMQASALARMLYSEQQLYEVMVDFWSNHFNIFLMKKFVRVLKPADDRDVIRAHALGNFRELLRASAHSPAMLFYLDNHKSTADGPNENYARELLELQTLGVDGGYTQQDVAEIARAFTGWGIENDRHSPEMGQFKFRPQWHDDGPKTILGQEFPAQGWKTDGDRVLDMLASHPSTARFISRKLCKRFISDAPPEAAVTAAADTFTQTDGDIKAVLRTIFNRPEFWHSAGQKVKRPLDFVVSAVRVLDLPARNLRPLLRAVQQLGQAPFMWPAPNGYPDTASDWINTNALLTRWNLMLQGTQSWRIRRHLQIPLRSLDHPTAEEVLNLYSGLVLNRTLPEALKPLLVQVLKPDIMDNVPTVVGLLLASPYFQYR